jgi:hypothetical protein
MSQAYHSARRVVNVGLIKYVYGTSAIVGFYAIVLEMWVLLLTFTTLMNVSELEAWKYAAYTPLSTQTAFTFFLFLVLCFLAQWGVAATSRMVSVAFNSWMEEIANEKFNGIKRLM